MLGLGQTFLEHKPEASSPSDHATVFFTLGLGLMLGSLRKLGALLVAAPSAWLVTRALRWRQSGERLLDVLAWLYRRVYPAVVKRVH